MNKQSRVSNASATALARVCLRHCWCVLGRHAAYLWLTRWIYLSLLRSYWASHVKHPKSYVLPPITPYIHNPLNINDSFPNDIMYTNVLYWLSIESFLFAINKGIYKVYTKYIEKTWHRPKGRYIVIMQLTKTTECIMTK